MKKDNQRVRLTKKLLKDALVRLLKKVNINKITTKALCLEAGINRSTFYNYYTDPFDLLREIEDELLASLEKDLIKIDSDPINTHYLTAILTYIKDNSDIFTVLLINPDSDIFLKRFLTLSDSNLHSLLKLNCSRDKADYIFHFVIMGSSALITKWVGSGFLMPIPEVVELLLNLSNHILVHYQ